MALRRTVEPQEKGEQMSVNLQKVDEFFEVFARTSKGSDVLAMAEQFAPVFLAGGPQGTQAVRREDFAAALPRRKQMFKSCGQKRSELAGVEATALDSRHALARTRWRMIFEREDGREAVLELESIYIVDTGKEKCEIVVYLACQDVAAMVKERGLLRA
jgi:hypothetical protein